jgi:cellulose synthase operon protein YhjQ
MDGQKPEAVEEQPRVETPEDVAVLYSWANLQGARYRDFSGARRQLRAQMRHRAAEEAKASESRGQAEAEAAAAVAERAAREAEEIARLHEKAARRAAEARQRRDLEQEEKARASAMRQATELSQRAAAERVQAARRAEGAASAEAAARRETREIADARASAERQALRYAESEMRRRALAGPQPVSKLPGEITDPYVPEPEAPAGRVLPFLTPEVDMRPSRYPQTRDVRQVLPPAEGAGSEGKAGEAKDARGAFDRAGGWVGKSGGRNAVGAGASQAASAIQSSDHPAASSVGAGEATESGRVDLEQSESVIEDQETIAESPLPAWLVTEGKSLHAEEGAEAREISPVDDTLQQSRELVASRWFALRGLFDQGTHEQAPEIPVSRSGEVPVLAVFSLAGGVGKTSLVATLGRALSSTGEKVLLTDTTSHGLLPFYFGASELKPGVVRTFAPPMGSADAPVHLLSFDVREKGGDLEAQEALAEELSRDSQGMQRVLVDLSAATPWVARRLARMNTLMIVPMAPDMSSIISLGAVEKFFTDMVDGNGRAIHPCYLLNGFDASQPLHLDVREVLRQQLGDRLLPFVIRRSPAISEALAEGMTVMDYAPEAGVAGDFMNLAAWLRTQSAPAPGFRKARWSEQ